MANKQRLTAFNPAVVEARQAATEEERMLTRMCIGFGGSAVLAMAGVLASWGWVENPPPDARSTQAAESPQAPAPVLEP